MDGITIGPHMLVIILKPIKSVVKDVATDVVADVAMIVQNTMGL